MTARRKEGLGPELCVTWLLAPLLVAFGESFITAPSFTDRDLLIALPAVALALGGICTSRHVPALAGYGALAVLVALRMVVLVPTYGKSPEDWSRATDYLVASSAAGTCVAFYPSDARMAIDYYLETQHQSAQGRLRPVLPTTPFSQSVAYLEEYQTLTATQLHAVTSECASLWLVSSHEGSQSGTAVSRANYQRFVDLRRALEHAYPSKRTTTFGWAARITLEYFQR
jgi:hypothetical protein